MITFFKIKFNEFPVFFMNTVLKLGFPVQLIHSISAHLVCKQKIKNMCLNLIFSSLDVISNFCSKNLMDKHLIKCPFGHLLNFSCLYTISFCFKNSLLLIL